MATEASHYFADKIHDALFFGADIEVPEHLTVKIFATLPDLDDEGGVESDYDGYAKQDVACGASSKWAAPSLVTGAMVTSNSDDIEFPESIDDETKSAAGYGVYDDEDNLLWLETKAFSIAPGFQPIIEAGDLVFGFKATATASYDLQTKVLNAFCRNTAFTALTSIDIEEYTTVPSKADAGGVKASYTGYADGTVVCDDEDSEWDAPIDSSGMRLVANTNEVPCGTANTGTSQTILGVGLRANDDTLLFVSTYAASYAVAVGTTVVHKAGHIRIRF